MRELWSVPLRTTLVEQSLVQHVQQLLAGEVPAQVLAEEIGLRGVDQVRHDVRGVGADDYAVEIPQRALFGQGLDLEHVERRSGEMAAPERLDERRLVDYGTPTHVGEVSSLPGCGNCLGVDQPPRLGGARERNGDVVGPAERGVKLRRRVQLVGVVPGLVVVAHRALDPDYAHAERARPPRYGATDTSHPDDAKRLVL